MAVTLERRGRDSFAAVELERRGRHVTGRAEGEGGSALDVRLCALACVDALEQLTDGRLSLALVGVKALRVFDEELVAVLVRSRARADLRLVGVALVAGGDVNRSGVLAVLNATNRVVARDSGG